MNSRLLITAGILLIAVAGSVLLIQTILPESALATLLVRASNGGVALTPDDGAVSVYTAGSSEHFLTDGQIEKPFALAPGRYDVRVRFTRTRNQQTLWLRDLELTPGAHTVEQVEFAAGEINVEATAGSANSEPGLVVVYVFETGKHDDIVTSMGSGVPALLGAGSYDLRVVWSVGTEEKDARWFHGVQVKVGLQTRLNVPFDRGTLKVSARNAGQPMDLGTVALTVYRADDLQRAVLDTGLAGVPMGLASGVYDILATFTGSNDRPQRWLRGVEIRDGQTSEQAVEFSSGSLVVDAGLQNGDTLRPFDVYVYYYRAGDHQQAVAYTPAGDTAVLESGRYDIRATFFRSNDQPDIWIPDLAVNPGEAVARTVSFPSGRLLVRAYDERGAELIGDNVFIYVYAADQHSRPVTFARSGELVTLTAGVYDIRAADTRDKTQTRWIEGIRLQTGLMTEQAVTF